LQSRSILAKRKNLIGRNRKTLGHSPRSRQSEPANHQADPEQMLQNRNNLRPHSRSQPVWCISTVTAVIRARHPTVATLDWVEKPTNSALKAKRLRA